MLALFFLWAAASPALEVRGDVAKPLSLAMADVEAMPSLTIDWDHHGEKQVVRGVALVEILRRAGWSEGPSGKEVAKTEKHSGARFVLVVTAADGYQAVFSAGEFTEGKTVALLASAIDGKPLAMDAGPLRLVVASDSSPARSLFQVRRIDVVDMRRIVTR
jgi:DMSO/TMAO reductase YedYZ molybdopterin-dependent catalytic subunit